MKTAAFWAFLIFAPLAVATAWGVLPPHVLNDMPPTMAIMLMDGTAMVPGIVLILLRHRPLGIKLAIAAGYAVAVTAFTPMTVFEIECYMGNCLLF